MDETIEKLISFLIEHIYIVVVVIGFIYSIFFRKSPIEKKPPNRMPDFGGGGSMLPQRPKRQMPPVGAPMAEPSIPQSQRTASSPDVRPLSDWSEPSQSGLTSAAAQASASSAASAVVLTKSDMRRAIVWAEIIGPPRARKPYRR